MCIVFFKQNHGNYKLIIAGNRDENIARETVNAHFWDISNDILGGTDISLDKSILNNGTWMAISKSKKFGFLTNNWETQKTNCISRGYLIRDFLTNQIDPLDYVKDIEAQHMNYNGFNLIVGEVDGQMCYVTNREESGTVLEPGKSYCISNTTLSHIQEWPKVRRGSKLFDEAIEHKNLKTLMDSLLTMLTDSCEITKDVEHFPKYSICLKPIRFRGVNYATRTHTVIIVDENDMCYFCERDRDQSYPDRYFEFKLE
jgi:uncharacterized protein with NRDE domain